MAGHTPGPWEVVDPTEAPDYVFRPYREFRAPEIKIICRQGGGFPTVPIGVLPGDVVGGGVKGAKANAKLIAAAPDMLHVILTILKDIECYCADNVAAKGPCAVCEAKTAIAKAV